MAVRLLYFAWIREQVGLDEEDAALPDNLLTAADLASWLMSRGGGYAIAFAEPARIRCALDQQMVPMTALIAGATEIAFFPPVTGG